MLTIESDGIRCSEFGVGTAGSASVGERALRFQRSRLSRDRKAKRMAALSENEVICAPTADKVTCEKPPDHCGAASPAILGELHVQFLKAEVVAVQHAQA